MKKQCINHFSRLVFSLAVLFSLQGIGQTSISGNKSGILTKVQSPYIISGSVTIPAGQTLTIEAGVEIRSSNFNDSFTVLGTLVANGTVSDSIKFVGFANSSVDPNSTHGGVIRFESSSINSQLEYVVFDRMGDLQGGNGNIGAIYINTTGISISKSLIKNSEKYGIKVDNSIISPKITNCNFLNNGTDIASFSWTSSNIGMNSNAVIELHKGTSNQSATLRKQNNNSYFRIRNNCVGDPGLCGFSISIRSSDTLRIEPGVEIRAGEGKEAFEVYGTLIAKGTPNDSIKFSSVNSFNSSGGRLSFSNGNGRESLLEYVSIDRWGGQINGQPFSIYISTSNISIRNSTIKNSNGIVISSSNNYKPLLQANNFLNSSNKSTMEGQIESFERISNNSNVDIILYSNTIANNVSLSFPGNNSGYYISGKITVPQTKTLTLQEGVTIFFQSFNFSPAPELLIEGALFAIGTASAKINFLGYLNRPGGKITLTSNSSGSIIQNVNIDRLSNALDLNTNNVTISNVTISNSLNRGIYCSFQGSPIVSNSNFYNNSTSVEVNSGKPTFQNCNFINNTNYGINNLSTAIGDTVSAINCFWGSSTGPKHPTINPSGLGDRISNKVKVIPFNPQSIDGGTFDIGITNIINPTTDCNLTNSTIISVNIKNFGSYGVNNFPIYYKVGNLSPVQETYSGNSILPGQTLTYTFSLKADFSALGNYTIKAFAKLVSDGNVTNDTTKVLIKNLSGLATPTLLSPVDNSLYVNTPVTLSWNPVVDASKYEVYIWKFNEVAPSSPLAIVENLTSYSVSKSFFQEGFQYKWKIVAKQGSCQSESNIFNFTTKVLSTVFDIGISSIISPITDCNYTNSTLIKVKISNYGNSTVSSFPIFYKINSLSPVQEIISGLTLLPGQTYDYSFNTKANLSAVGTYSIVVYTSLSSDILKNNDSLRTIIQHLSSVGTPTNLIPTNNTIGLDLAIPLSWSAIPNVTGYDLFVWETAQPVPTSPRFSNLGQINFSLPNDILSYATQYSWKVKAKRGSCSAESIVQTFTTKQLPDLSVESINRPSTAISENDITISYIIKNIGSGSTTSGSWRELVYLCDQQTLFSGVDNFLMSDVQNFSSLNSGQQYQSVPFTFKIPQGIFGTYYIIVQTNSSNSLTESDITNNIKVSQPINITLAPHADLQVIQPVVATPQTIYSEDTLTITYIVKNFGAGATTVNNWQDQIYLSNDEVLNSSNAIQLSTYNRTEILASNAEYSVTSKVKLPSRINGTYFVHIFTDKLLKVFEFNDENNNTAKSLPITIIQKPTPDLTVTSVVASLDSIANNQPITVQWSTDNEGTTMANPSWLETIFISSTNTFDESSSQAIGNITRNTAINSLNSLNGQLSVNIPPSLVEGSYYFFIKTNADNTVYESPNSFSNVSTASPVIKVVNVDLKPTFLTANPTALSEENIIVQWKIKNESRAVLMNNNWKDRVYLSTNNTFDSDTDILLGSISSNQILGKGSEYNKQLTVKIPAGTQTGNYYLLLISDADNKVFEKNELNNVFSKAISITLIPSPDLQITNIIAPAIDSIGTSINIQYTGRNSGVASINNKTWNDAIYLSLTNNISETNLIYLGNVTQNRTLNSNQTYSQSVSFTIPEMSVGQYYIFVKSDINNAIFENVNETNNTSITTSSTTIRRISTDLSIINGKILTPLVTAGQTINIEWTVKNVSNNSISISSWKDGVYLSPSSFFNNNAVLLSTEYNNVILTTNGSYSKSATVTIPQSANGTQYILVSTDIDNLNNDLERINNTLALDNLNGGKGFSIIIPPPADLTPISFTSQAQGTVAQPINLSFTINNQGTGATPSNNWKDAVYISTDFQLDVNDIFVGSFVRNANLPANGSYTTTEPLFLPNNISGGNYVLILKTDSDNNVFERNGENNNIAFANIFVNPQQPSDLFVSTITVPPSEQVAGNTSKIKWQLKNIGSNTASGFLRQAVYLSKDNQLNATDILFGVLDKTINLAPQALVEDSLTQILSNVSIGDYYVIVKTDLLNNIIEQNENNNISIATAKLKVNVKPLIIGTIQKDSLSNGSPLYYRVDIPVNLIGQTMGITIKGDSVNNANNRLYVSKGKVPTSNDYQFIASIPFKSNQEIRIPTLEGGTYYIVITGTNLNPNKQGLDILAKIVPFSIATVEVNKGGNTGTVTVKILGANFDPNMVLRLKNSATTKTAAQIQFIDASLVYATFDLANATIGQYDVEAEKQDESTAKLTNGFEVEAGSSDGLDIDIYHQPNTRPNRIVPIKIVYTNTGNVDIPIPKRFILATRGAPISKTVIGLEENRKDIYLELKEDNNLNMLRPGASGIVTVHTKAIRELRFIVTQ